MTHPTSSLDAITDIMPDSARLVRPINAAIIEL